jgi:general secretion pathway protein A
MKFTDFGFKENPFSITPDPRYLYLSRGHEESLAHLIYGTGPNGGFVLLTGEVGTGKTLLIRSLLAQQLADVDIALVLNPRLSRREFLATICDELGVKYPGPPYSLKQLSDILSKHLLKTHGEGRHTVLVVDEAQNLSPRVLEQVRLLTNLETTRHKLLRIILVGQPELLQTLAHKELRQVDQRITARYHLSPLDRQETARYIVYRLAVAGIREDLFTPMAMRLVHRFSGGVPRRINTLCERTLLAIFSRGKSRVGVDLVWRAAREIRGERQRSTGWRHWLLLALVPLVIGVVLYAYLTPELEPDQLASDVTLQEKITSMAAVQNVLPPPEAVENLQTPGALIKLQTEPSALPQAAQKHLEDGLGQGESAKLEETAGHEPSAVLDEFNLSACFAQPQDQNKVYQALFALWGETTNADSPFTPCMQAPDKGLRCFRKKSDWDDLMKINRPLILWLKREKQQRQVVLKWVDGEDLVVDDGVNEGLLTRSQLKGYWDGEVLLLWRPYDGVALIGEGSAGKAVTWLRRQLHLADGQPVVETEGVDHFDDKLKARLQSFQRERGLLVDGVAGQQTSIYLNNLSLPSGTPTLRPSVVREGN